MPKQLSSDLYEHHMTTGALLEWISKLPPHPGWDEVTATGAIAEYLRSKGLNVVDCGVHTVTLRDHCGCTQTRALPEPVSRSLVYWDPSLDTFVEALEVNS